MVGPGCLTVRRWMIEASMSAQTEQVRQKVTIPTLVTKKQQGSPITMLTAYDYSSALLVDKAGMDIILVGDSLAMVMMGLDSTNPVTMEVMLHHGRMVARGAKQAFLVGDMPFMSFQVSVEEAVRCLLYTSPSPRD